MRRNIYETQEFYAVAVDDGYWFTAHDGPYKTMRNAQKEAERARRWGGRGCRVVKMVPMFFDVETGERITPLQEGMMM